MQWLFIAVAVVIFLFWATRRRVALGAPVRTKSCVWQRVDVEDTRALLEYRCAVCGENAYGHNGKPPHARPCKGAK